MYRIIFNAQSINDETDCTLPVNAKQISLRCTLGHDDSLQRYGNTNYFIDQTDFTVMPISIDTITAVNTRRKSALKINSALVNYSIHCSFRLGNCPSCCILIITSFKDNYVQCLFDSYLGINRHSSGSCRFTGAVISSVCGKDVLPVIDNPRHVTSTAVV